MRKIFKTPAIQSLISTQLQAHESIMPYIGYMISVHCSMLVCIVTCSNRSLNKSLRRKYAGCRLMYRFICASDKYGTAPRPLIPLFRVSKTIMYSFRWCARTPWATCVTCVGLWSPCHERASVCTSLLVLTSLLIARSFDPPSIDSLADVVSALIMKSDQLVFILLLGRLGK